MVKRYKIILSNSIFYKEIELSQELQQAKVGTGLECDFRLRKELFFENVELLFIKQEDNWTVSCSDGLYFSLGDVRKLMTLRLTHGDILQIKYQESDILVMTMTFLFDFDAGDRVYNRIINVDNAQTISIGTTPNCNIVIRSDYFSQGIVALQRKSSSTSFIIADEQTPYGVNINGNRAGRGDKLSNGDYLEISDFAFYFKNGILWTQNRSDMKVTNFHFRDINRSKNYPKFNRNTRIKYKVCEDKIEVLDPPSQPTKPKDNIFTRLLPSMGMLITSGAMAFFGGTMVIFSAISGAMAIITSVIGIREGKKEYKENVKDRIEKYTSYIERKREEIQNCRTEEKKVLEEIYISPETEKQRIEQFSWQLFDRTQTDDDFLHVRLGRGDILSKREINYKKQEKLEIDDDLQKMPEQLSEEYKNIHDAPVVVDFHAINAIGVVGTYAYRYEQMKNIIFDIISRQYHSDVKFVLIAKNEHKKEVLRFRFLPQVKNDILGVRNIVCDDESKNLMLEYLYKEFTIREQNKKYENEIVIFFFDEYGFRTHPISKFIDKARDLGITFVFFGNSVDEIPQRCDYIISIKDDQSAVLIKAENQNEATSFVYPGIQNEYLDSIIQILAPIYTEEISLESTLTKSISMFELLNILTVEDLDLTARWNSTQVFKSMSAPIGVSKAGIVSLDLHDKAHGPHGLVAGTTGSGKSELLQTYVLAMATLFHPYEVAFVIIDFKGGGMVNQFTDLPHLLGAITNIDGKEINRSLKSIKAELQKRQRLFAEAEVNHIDKYIKKYKAKEVTIPLPHLIIIVDEFAELKAEQPEFMKELISAARIGRSLGVHLILATQKPSGQVNEQIWSNSRFKLCLKVQTPEDSNEMLKSPLAAEIKEPGRAYLQVGNNEIFELFQSAYSGAPERTEGPGIKEFKIFELTESGKRALIYEQKKSKGQSQASNRSQLDAIVQYVSQYADERHIERLPSICLPSLAEVIDFTTQKREKSDIGVRVDFGIFDDPDNQFQGTYSVDLTEQNIMIIGSAQTGKTNLLQVIIRNIAEKYTPQEVNLYIIDFASMVLKNFERLNHVGGVVIPSEDEKLKNLMKLLYGEITSRREKLLSEGVSSYRAYREAGKTDLPFIVLLIDNVTALKELYFQDDDELLNLCREGLSVGISIVIANAQTSGIGYKYLSNFSARIAMYCNDTSEYGSLFDHCRETVDDVKGRCLVEIEKEHLDCQTYLAFKGEKEYDRAKEIHSFVDKINADNRTLKAKRIPLIPQLLTEEYVISNFGNEMQEPFRVMEGLDYETIDPFVLDYKNLGAIAVSSKDLQDQVNFIKYNISVLQQMYPQKTEIYIVDDIQKALSELKTRENVKYYDFIASNSLELVKKLEERVRERYEALITDEDILKREPLLLLILNSRDAVEMISNDMSALSAYENIVGRYKNMNIAVIVGNYENTNVSYSSPEILKKLRDSRHFIFFDDLSALKVFDVPLSVLRQFKKPIEKGDCYYIKDAECRKIKTTFPTVKA